MFKIESYVTPILLSYVDKYVRDFKPADAQVSLWGGGVALHNLVLKADVLQQEVALPFTLVSGRIHELLIQVPWTKIMSEPIVITIDTIECVLNLNPPAPQDDNVPPAPPRRTQVVEAPPGYMQALVRRIVSNIALRVHHLIVKYVQDDIVLSLNVKHLAVDSAGPSWEPAFADIDQAEPVLRRLVRLDDLTLCLDRADSDGKIRFYQEPLLYRCQLDLRVLTRLVSANTRRATGLSVHLRSSKLAWGVTNDQLVLLLRLLNESPRTEAKPPPPAPKMAAQVIPMHPLRNSAEPARTESWSEWAWSWLPSWAEGEGAEEAPAPAAPIPVAMLAYLDDVSLVLKVMEVEGSTRKRARPVLELSASHAAVKSSVRAPTLMRVRVGLRRVSLAARGKCPCGHVPINAAKAEPTVYLSKLEETPSDEPWSWPENQPTDAKIELAQVADEVLHDAKPAASENPASEQGYPEEPAQDPSEAERTDPLWEHMAPLIFLEYSHERSPPQPYTNPYENPPTDFQYSDWVELCTIRVRVRPLSALVCPGLLHRVKVLRGALGELPPSTVPELPTRTLTVEECDALMENLPQKRISIEMSEVRVKLVPWDHAALERSPELLALELAMPKAIVVITGPLYPHRVCSAACQMPEDSGPLWNGARMHMSCAVSGAHAQLSGGGGPRPCARADLRAVVHVLLNRHMFAARRSVAASYSLKIREINVCGSLARLQAATHVIKSLVHERLSPILKHSTLAKDAFNDEESVAIDLTAEDWSVRGYLTHDVSTHILTLQTARGTVYQPSSKENEMKQAWLFSAPEASTTTQYLRVAVQWCPTGAPGPLEYAGVWTEPVSLSADPLFIAWLAYKPANLAPKDSYVQLNVNPSTHQYGLRRLSTPPQSSSGRAGSRAGSSAELVHVRPRSAGSSSEHGERRDPRPQPSTVKPEPAEWDGESVVRVHERLRRALVSVELGLVLVYASGSSASALDCATVHDALERHARDHHPVLALSLGRVSIHSSSAKKHLWEEIRHDGPTYIDGIKDEEADSFPWKLRLADVSCYTLGIVKLQQKSSKELQLGQRSQLKVAEASHKTVLEMVTTTVTLSVVTKSLHIKTVKRDKKERTSEEDIKTKYFTAGMDFKPSSLKEFFRGPANRKKTTTHAQSANLSEREAVAEISGQLVSLGVHLHADTPPIIVRLDDEQVHLVATAVHGLQHILALLRSRPFVPPRSQFTSAASRCSLIRSVSEIEEIQTPSEEALSEKPSKSRSDLVPIFESYNVSKIDKKVKTFFWFQWVVSRATLVVASRAVKLAFDMDDIISTVDMQAHYNQLKVKVASASVRHYERADSNDWKAGVLGGRVLEAREPTDVLEENHFMSVTITQAQISNLPAHWKEELHPKLLEEKSESDTMWEIYATVAPLEAVLQPEVVKNITSLVKEFAPRSFCPLQEEVTESRQGTWQWPTCYVNAGGLRLLLTTEESERLGDDTFIFQISKLTVSPYPENPICRRPVNTATELNWMGGQRLLEGQQYEFLIHGFAIKSAQLHQLVRQEVSENELMKGTGGENPALKWTQPVVAPNITTVLHNVDIGVVVAPAIFAAGVVASGPAAELNLVSDCALDVSVAQVCLAATIAAAFVDNRSDEMLDKVSQCDACPFAPLLVRAADSHTFSGEGIFSEDITKPNQQNAATEAADSGVDTVTSHSTLKSSRFEETAAKKASVFFADYSALPSEYLELFLTMGVIDISLYAADDGEPALAALRPPAAHAPQAPAPDPAPAAAASSAASAHSAPSNVKTIFEETERKEDDVNSIGSGTKSISDMAREHDNINQFKTNLRYGKHNLHHQRKNEGIIPLLHVTLHQPNFYYWRRKAQKNFQVSLFNAWVGLGSDAAEGRWSAPLLSTARGAADPVTDIPPALATARLTAPAAPTGSQRGSIQLDVERPVQIEVSADRVRRIQAILALITSELPEGEQPVAQTTAHPLPILYRLRRFFIQQSVESMTVRTSQLSICGVEGVVGCDSASLQVGVGARPHRVHARALVHALTATAGPPTDRRRPLLQPTALGLSVEASWEAWRRAEGGPGALQPTLHVCLDADHVCCEVRPSELAALARLHAACMGLAANQQSSAQSVVQAAELTSQPSSCSSQTTRTPASESELSDHYYKDDLRSGAFKLVGGGQLPMAYQVTLHAQTVAWRYPHPRAVTRVLAFPLPDQDEETECVLEFFNPVVGVWHLYARFNVPVAGPTEIKLFVTAPDAVFAQMWRIRPRPTPEPQQWPFEFDPNRYTPRADPLVMEHPLEAEPPEGGAGERAQPGAEAEPVSAEQLCGAVRVDSFFAPRALPRLRACVRIVDIRFYIHNDLPKLPRLDDVYLFVTALKEGAQHLWGTSCTDVDQSGAYASLSGVTVVDNMIHKVTRHASSALHQKIIQILTIATARQQAVSQRNATQVTCFEWREMFVRMVPINGRLDDVYLFVTALKEGAQHLWGTSCTDVDQSGAYASLSGVTVVDNMIHNEAKSLEGYYVSRPLLRAHRVLALAGRDVHANMHVGAPAGATVVLEASLASDIVDCATGTMEPLVAEFRAQVAAAAAAGEWANARVRACATDIRVALDVPRLRALHTLADDWRHAAELHFGQSESNKVVEEEPTHVMSEREADAARALEGRVAMWIHNTCACALRVGQDDTDERVPLGPGAHLAYRWRSPVAPKALRIAFAGPVTDWLWSSSVPFTPGSYRVRLENAEALGNKGAPGSGVYAHVRVEGEGARQSMRLEGRLALANLLRHNLLYKVRTRSPEAKQWQTAMSGELEAESVGRSVMCVADCEMALKIKFTTQDSGWSGDIPLKECPKENVPWLVKVPSEGELAYISVWCRVVRARSDGRVLAAVWPLYVLYSHVPLDTDVTIETAPAPGAESAANRPAPLVQSALGRGAATHLIAPGTTSARHYLTFQYRNIDCPVTREAVPLHYGVTDTSVFDKRAPVQTIEDVTQDILAWLERSGRHATSSWPYSTVMKHWPGDWQPALLQPRCDVNVWYEAVRAGGGCSLELRLAPAVLLCNAAPVALTLRAHDATPLCKLEPGAAVAPPSIVLQKPFFISMELARDTFVSGQLAVSSVEPGRYGAPPPGHLAPDHPAPFAIHCSNKVALLTMYYEITHKINVLGVSSTYEFINKLDSVILVSALALPKDFGDSIPLRPKAFKIVKPSKETSVHGVPLARFWLGARWRSGGAPGELAAFVCMSLPAPDAPPTAVPVRLGRPPYRRAISLQDATGRSVAVVVTQMQHEGRWLVTAARDPCPQYLLHNHTGDPLAVAQPAPACDPSTSGTTVVSECEGAAWWVVAGPGEATHYSSPAHCARYPPPGPQGPAVQFLTFAKVDRDECIDCSSVYWCPPVAVTEGEQLVQLYSSGTVKLRVRTHPHSTLLELRDVDENDISASDIRNRLLKPYITTVKTNQTTSAESCGALMLEREDADQHLLGKEATIDSLEPFKAGGSDHALDADAALVVEPDADDKQTDHIQTEDMLLKQVENLERKSQVFRQKLDVGAPKAFDSQKPETIEQKESPRSHIDGGEGTSERELEKTNIQKIAREVKYAGSLRVIKDPSVLPMRSTVTIREDTFIPESNINIINKDRQESESEACNILNVTSSYAGLSGVWAASERARLVAASLSVEVAGGADEPPLLALHLDRAALLLHHIEQGNSTTLSVAGFQIDNLQYSSGQYDFAVVATTTGERAPPDEWPSVWAMLIEWDAFRLRRDTARVLLTVRRDQWTVPSGTYSEITEVELAVGPLALYVEDAYVSALVEVCRRALPADERAPAALLLADEAALRSPLRLRALRLHPLQLTLTLHTAVRMYIALDQSPLQLGAFQLQDAMTTVERLTHALTVHYLSAAILGAGWVVGGLELLGAPGALAARVGGAGGGVRGVAAAAAAALVRSLAACAGSLARNLDLLAGDEEHARRAAAARRRHPHSLAAGILAGLTNFAINILGAVGGLAHHPLVGVAVGEGGGAAALRRSLVGAVAKPLSATADLLAYAGHGLLTQAGWHTPPQARGSWWLERRCSCAVSCAAGWRRDCVRWAFRLADLEALAGFEATLNHASLALLLTHKFLVIADLETDNIVEMIDLRSCMLQPYQGQTIELCVVAAAAARRGATLGAEPQGSDDVDEFRVSSAAMARVARYTGAEGASAGVESRRLALVAEPGQALALHAALATVLRQNCDTHFPLL